LYSGPIIAERGFQLFDLPVVATAVGGALGIIYYRHRTYESLIAIGAGLSAFLVAVGIGWSVGGGLWVVSWGFYVTLGGAIGMVYAGLFGLSSLNTDTVGHK
jgi:peptidoglycan/LPS O-acetylase OafA/YrhL